MKKKELKIIKGWLNSLDTTENGSATPFAQKEITYLKNNFECAREWLYSNNKEQVSMSFNERELEYLIRVLRRAFDE